VLGCIDGQPTSSRLTVQLGPVHQRGVQSRWQAVAREVIGHVVVAVRPDEGEVWDVRDRNGQEFFALKGATFSPGSWSVSFPGNGQATVSSDEDAIGESCGMPSRVTTLHVFSGSSITTSVPYRKTTRGRVGTTRSNSWMLRPGPVTAPLNGHTDPVVGPHRGTMFTPGR